MNRSTSEISVFYYRLDFYKLNLHTLQQTIIMICLCMHIEVPQLFFLGYYIWRSV